MCNNPALGLNETKGISGICSQVWIDNSFLSAHANTCFLKTILTHTISHIFTHILVCHANSHMYPNHLKVRCSWFSSIPAANLSPSAARSGRSSCFERGDLTWFGRGCQNLGTFFGSWFNDLCIWFCNRSADPTVWMLSGWGNVLLFFSQLLVAHYSSRKKKRVNRVSITQQHEKTSRKKD